MDKRLTGGYVSPMTKKPITAANMARLRAESQTPERRKEVASKAGRAWWDSLTPEEREERTRKLTAARRAKANGGAEKGKTPPKRASGRK